MPPFNPTPKFLPCHEVTSIGGDSYTSPPPSDLGPVTAISAGFGFTLALRLNGTVACWLSPNIKFRESGVDYGACDVPVGLADVTNITAGWLHGMAITSNGTVVVWGSYVSLATSPYTILGAAAAFLPTFSQRIVAVAGGSAHSLALTESGKVIAWGENIRHQLDMPSILGGMSQETVYSGKHRSLSQVQTMMDQVPDPGILAYEDYTVESNPPPSQQDYPSINSPSTGFFGGYLEGHSGARRPDASVSYGASYDASTGASTSSKGQGSSTSISGPSVDASGGAVVIAISANAVNSIALLSNGSVVVWGDNSHNQLSVPTSVSTGQASMVTAGWLHYVVVLAADAGVAAWGMNDGGESTAPAGLTGVTAVAAGYRYSSVLFNNGTFDVWGIMYGFGDSILPDLPGILAIAGGFEQLEVIYDCSACEFKLCKIHFARSSVLCAQVFFLCL